MEFTPMLPKSVPPSKERIAAAFKQLSVVSTELNAAADELSSNISTLDKALRKLNLGVSAWHEIASNEDDEGTYWSRDIGYTQVENKWGIALRKTRGNHNFDHYEEEVWPFADAPRWMCIESIGKLPDLFDDLIKRTKDTTDKIKKKTAEAKELAGAISSALTDLASEQGRAK